MSMRGKYSPNRRAFAALVAFAVALVVVARAAAAAVAIWRNRIPHRPYDATMLIVTWRGGDIMACFMSQCDALLVFRTFFWWCKVL